MIPYPDVTDMPEELGLAVCRMVRLVNEMRRRHPEIDQLAVSTETDLDRRAVRFLSQWVDSLGLDFSLMVSPWDGRTFMEGEGPFGPAPVESAEGN